MGDTKHGIGCLAMRGLWFLFVPPIFGMGSILRGPSAQVTAATVEGESTDGRGFAKAMATKGLQARDVEKASAGEWGTLASIVKHGLSKWKRKTA